MLLPKKDNRLRALGFDSEDIETWAELDEGTDNGEEAEKDEGSATDECFEEEEVEVDNLDVEQDEQMERELEGLDDVLQSLPSLPVSAQCEAMFVLRKVSA